MMEKRGVFRVHSERCDYGRHRRLFMALEMSDGRELIGRLRFEEDVTNRILRDEDGSLPVVRGETALRADEFLQAVLDHAWAAGLRPAGFLDTPNQIAALQNHLQDMRALLFAATGGDVAGVVKPAPDVR